MDGRASDFGMGIWCSGESNNGDTTGVGQASRLDCCCARRLGLMYV